MLIKIRDALTAKHYHYANISLGPRLPIEDDDIHTWTAILDEIVAKTETLTTIAVGNDGDLSNCLLYTSPSPRDRGGSRMPSSA